MTSHMKVATLCRKSSLFCGAVGNRYRYLLKAFLSCSKTFHDIASLISWSLITQMVSNYISFVFDFRWHKLSWKVDCDECFSKKKLLFSVIVKNLSLKLTAVCFYYNKMMHCNKVLSAQSSIQIGSFLVFLVSSIQIVWSCHWIFSIWRSSCSDNLTVFLFVYILDG